MEGFRRKIEKAARTALAGAALLGGIAASEPRGAEAAPLQSYEQQDFDFKGEANAFLAEIASLDEGMGDARARHDLQRKVSDKLDAFALACQNRTPYFSAAGGAASLSGTITLDARNAAKKYLHDMLLRMPSSTDMGTALLRQMVAGTTAAPQEVHTSSPTPQRSEPGHMPSEVRKNRMGNDW